MTRAGPVDDRFVAFADVVRRRLLDHLHTAPSGTRELPFEDLVSRLAADAEIGPSTESQTRLNLVHVHLPKLEQAGLVERDGGTVRLVVAPGVVADGLALADEFESA